MDVAGHFQLTKSSGYVRIVVAFLVVAGKHLDASV